MESPTSVKKVKKALNFLTNPGIQPKPWEEKVQFMLRKGLTPDEIEEARRLTEESALGVTEPAAGTASPAARSAGSLWGGRGSLESVGGAATTVSTVKPAHGQAPAARRSRSSVRQTSKTRLVDWLLQGSGVAHEAIENACPPPEVTQLPANFVLPSGGYWWTAAPIKYASKDVADRAYESGRLAATMMLQSRLQAAPDTGSPGSAALGLHLGSFAKEARSIDIEGITAEGAIAEYNATALPDKVIRDGDWLAKVNGASDTAVGWRTLSAAALTAP